MAYGRNRNDLQIFGSGAVLCVYIHTSVQEKIDTYIIVSIQIRFLLTSSTCPDIGLCGNIADDDVFDDDDDDESEGDGCWSPHPGGGP